MFRAIPLAAALAATALAAGCSQPAAEAEVVDAWVRLPAVEGNPGAAYFTIHGGADARTLVAVRAPFAVRAELHESIHANGMMTMEPIADLAVPAGGELVFEPGAKHVMLFDIGPAVQAGTPVPLRFEFAEAPPIEVQAVVVGAGDPAPEF